MKHIIVFFSLLPLLHFAFPAAAQTEKEDAIDINYHQCLAKDTSVGNIDACAFIAYGNWNKEMDNAYNKLLKELKKPKDKAAFKQSQVSWKAFRDAEFTSYNNIFNYPGSAFCLLRQNGRIDIVRARTLQLRAYQESLKAATPKGGLIRKKKQQKT